MLLKSNFPKHKCWQAAYPFVNVRINGVIVHGEDVRVAVVVGQALVVDLGVGLAVQTLGKDGHDENVYLQKIKK